MEAMELTYSFDTFGTPSDESIPKAEQCGFRVLVPEADQLFLDMDSPEAVRIYRKNEGIVDKHIGIDSVRITPSKTPGHLHYTVRLKRKVTALERVE